jgi:hypothetical protein
MFAKVRRRRRRALPFLAMPGPKRCFRIDVERFRWNGYRDARRGIADSPET